MSRIALSIGITHTSGLATLPGAAPGARTFANWARKHGFNVHEFNDQDGLVRSGDIIDCVKLLVKQRGIEQFVVFFSGHGTATGPDEDYWFLSQGYEDLIDASNSINRARNIAKLRHVVFFADACRTAAASEHLHAGPGSPAIFPALTTGSRIATVDVFNGTITGKSALEALKRGEDQKIIAANGIFTEALQATLDGKINEVVEIDRERGTRVIYAQKLKTYLDKRVRTESSIRAKWTQNPDCRPTSGESLPLFDLGAAKVTPLKVRARLADGSPATGSTITILDLTEDFRNPKEVFSANGPEISHSLAPGIYGFHAELQDYLQDPNPPDPLARLLVPQAPVELMLRPVMALAQGMPDTPEPMLMSRYVIDQEGRRTERPPESGIYTVVNEDILTGHLRSELRLLTANEEPELLSTLPADMQAENSIMEMANAPARDHFETMTGISITGARVVAVLGDNAGWGHEGSYDFVRGNEPGSSVVVDLDDHRWAGLAELYGFQGEVIVGASGVESLRYRPAPGGPYDLEDLDSVEERRLLMMAEVAARINRYEEIFGDNARGVAAQLRQFKHQNPMLGVYAAYAYASSGAVDQIKSMIRYFVDQGQAVPFDIVMLSGVSIDNVRINVPILPAFPMLRRGWALLDRLGPVPDVLLKARANLTASMFTTVRGSAGSALGKSLEKGGPW